VLKSPADLTPSRHRTVDEQPRIAEPEPSPYRWVVLVFGILGYAATLFARQNYSGVQKFIAVDVHLDKGSLGLLGSVFRLLDKNRMVADAAAHMESLQIGIASMRQPVESLSGGQRQAVAVARSAFARHVVIMDEPTAALGVKESRMVLDLIRRVRDKGLPVIFISHNMPHVFDVADRIHIARLGKRVAVVSPREISMADAVAIMTGAI